MFRTTLDKVASSTKNAGIERDVYLSDKIIAEEGYVVAVRILSDKAVYNTLENEHGRMMRLKPGDRIAGVLGHRKALRGYSGEVPGEIKVGDRLNVLNLGGVIGKCSSYAPNVGEPFEVEMLGAVLHFPYLGERVSEPAHIGLNAIADERPADKPAPIVAVVGTCMNAGKTVAACQIINGLSRAGYTTAAAKVTGVALERDVLRMHDYGAEEALSFNDAGLVSTEPANALDAARRIIAKLNKAKPDAIVVEFGDGLLGEYGVQTILADKEFASWIHAVVLCANDPVAAWGGVPLLRDEYDLRAHVVTGPVTDNDVGRLQIESALHIPAANALTAPTDLVDHVKKEVFGDA
ncbi:MAG: hypothetical protein GY854_32505 [Deltaproteobacteria bacterium]|nr:hypothetical protein [Deltaproteobacteria bacterium]